MRRALLAAVAAAMLGLGGRAAGAPHWEARIQLSTGDRALAPELALNAGGDALVVWDQEVGAECPTQPAGLSCIHIVTAASRPRASAWQAPVEVSRPGVDSRPTAAIGSSGDAAILWVHDIGRDRVLQASYRRASTGTWPEPNDLSEPRLQIREHEIAVQAAGDALAVWSERAETSFAVKAAVRSSASGGWGAAVTLSGSTTVSAGPSLALSETGEAFAVWVEGGTSVRASRRDPVTGVWSSAVELSRSTATVAGAPQVAVDTAGDAAVAWTEQPGGEAGRRVQVAFRPQGGAWQAPSGLPPACSGTPTAPVVAVAGNGDTVVAWLCSGAVEAAARQASSGVWASPFVVATANERAEELQLAVDPAGNTAAAWRSAETSSVRAALRPGASGRWQSPARVTSPGATRPRVSLDAGGAGVAVWNETEGDRVAVAAARLDGTGPIVQRLLTPHRVAVGVRAPFSVDVVPWAAPLAGRPRWQFGDGRSATGARVAHRYARFGRYAVFVSQEDASGGSATARATVVVGAPRSTKRPSIQGNPRFGSTLTCVPGSWAGATPIRFGYVWLRDGFAIPGAARSRYRVGVDDLQETLGCRVRATNRLGSTVAKARQVLVVVGG